MKLKQHNVPWLGAIVDSVYTSLPILSILNFVSIQTVLYTTIKENLLPWAPWVTFGWYLLFLSAFSAALMILVFIFVVPSVWTWRSKQMHDYDSALMREVIALRDEIKDLKEGGGKKA